jgi:hypothetical protein
LEPEQPSQPDLYRSDHHPDVRNDILALPTLQLRKIALIRITQLVKGEFRVHMLEDLQGWADLGRGFYKLPFPEAFALAQTSRERRTVQQEAQGAYRIIYRILEPAPGADQRPRLQVIAVGPRVQGHVYETANSRVAQQRRTLLPPTATPALPAVQSAPALQRPRSLLEAQQQALQRRPLPMRAVRRG